MEIPETAAWVGSAVCAECHGAEAEAWRGSDHDRAMQEPDAESVLGDFEDARFEEAGTTWSFVRYQGKYLIKSEGRESGEYEVAYTFGADPLQQYLIAFPDGRLQALHVAWDTRPAAAGGQRWFSLHDAPPTVGDPLHWQSAAGNWNLLCGDCHSTGFRKGFDLAERTYASHWEEVDVGCEACHGAGGAHARWAAGGAGRGGPQLRVDYPAPTRWERADGAPIAHAASGAVSPDTEIDTCAPCHSRRTRLVDAAGPEQDFLDGYRPALLEPGLYHDDGQIADEVFVWGSYVQSKMYAAGVRCSDCHDPHSTGLRAEGNALCGNCHDPAVFDTRDHHHHAGDTPASQCTACHMPSRTYMQIDARGDHRFSIPRPEQSAALGTPSACDGCHADAAPGWAAEQLIAWRSGGEERTHFGRRLAMRHQEGAEAARALEALIDDRSAPAIARAAAFVGLATPSPERARAAAASPDALVRLAAASASDALPALERAAALAPLLSDPRHAVRIEAARALIDVPAELLTPDQRAARRREIEAFRAAQDARADEPGSHVQLASLHLRENRDGPAAEAAFRTALRVGPYFLPASLGLADLLGQLDRDDEGRDVLEAALERAPEIPDLHLALGMLHVRQGRQGDALAAFEAAREQAPQDPRVLYVLAVALHSQDRSDAALDLLREGLEAHPDNSALLSTLATMGRDLGAYEDALAAVDRLIALHPGNPQLESLRADIQSRAEGAP
ncbi:MAG: tetratricopeptide repeat protein [Myxococcota bacterium]